MIPTTAPTNPPPAPSTEAAIAAGMILLGRIGK